MRVKKLPSNLEKMFLPAVRLTSVFFGAMTARRNYPYGAFMNVMVKTMSDTSSNGFLRLEKNSTVQFSRYTPR